MQQVTDCPDVGTSSVDGVAHAFAKGYCLGLTLERHTHWGDVIGPLRWLSRVRFQHAVASGERFRRDRHSPTAPTAGPATAAASMLEAVLRGGAPRTRVAAAMAGTGSDAPCRRALDPEWDDDLADDVFAMNMDLDEPRAERRREPPSRAPNSSARSTPRRPPTTHIHRRPTSTGRSPAASATARIELGLTP
jgi:hypothetical protein